MIYFLTEQRIKDFSTVLGNVDIKLIAPLIPTSADLFIKPRTGSYFFNHLLTKYNSQTLNTDEEELVSLIQESLLWRAVSEVVLTSSAQITNKGPQTQNGLNSASADITRIGMLTKHYGAKAEFYDQRIINFIWTNKDKFPEFTNKLNMDCQADLYPSKSTPYNGMYFI